MHTHFPLHKLNFHYFCIYIFICIFIPHLYIRQTKIYKLTDIISHPSIYSNILNALNYQINYLKCVPYLKNFLPQTFFFLAAHYSFLVVSGISNIALSSLNLLNFCPFYTNQYLPKSNDWHMKYRNLPIDYFTY